MKRTILALAIGSLTVASVASAAPAPSTQNVNIQSSSIDVPVSVKGTPSVTVTGTPNVTVVNGTTNPVNVAVVNGSSYAAVYPSVTSFNIYNDNYAYQVLYTNSTSTPVMLTSASIWADALCSGTHPILGSFDVGVVRNTTEFVSIKTNYYGSFVQQAWGGTACGYTLSLPGPLVVAPGYSVRAYVQISGSGAGVTMTFYVGASGHTLP